jgi:hypothetical protein
MAAYYSVLIISYRTAAIKAAAERGTMYPTKVEHYRYESVYFGEDETSAMKAFYRASRKAMGRPLALSIQVWRDGKQLIRVVVEH